MGTKELAKAWQQKSKPTGSPSSFEGNSLVNNPTIGIPITVNLTQQEENQIQKILVDDYRPGTISEEAVQEHVQRLTDITRQIKSISAQSILLHGQRIKEAQEILKDYNDGAFSKWLMATYGNRQTPYSMLKYYELYQSAPISHKSLMETAPKKAMYLLAFRDGDIDKKMELIQNHSRSKQSDLILLIQETFPIAENDQRKPRNSSAVEALNKACQKLEKNKEYLSEDGIEGIQKIIERLQKLCHLG